VLSDWNVAYVTFAEELHRVIKKFHPSVWKWYQDYLNELKILAQKWKSKGLDPQIMKDIARVMGVKEIEQFL